MPIIRGMSLLFSTTILGRPIVKKNTAKRFRRCIVYSAKFRHWERSALLQIHTTKPPRFDFPIEVRLRFYFKNHQGEADVSNLCEAPNDLLEKAGIILNDRLITRLIGEKFFGHEARTEIEIYKA